MITLYGFGPAFGLPDPSPFVIKVEVLLRADPSVIGATGKRRLVTAHTLYRHSRKQAKPVTRLQPQEFK